MIERSRFKVKPCVSFIIVTIKVWILNGFGIRTVLVGASCSSDQVNFCRHAVEHGNLGNLPNAGECQARQYVHFTHICTVSNYLPNIDYCCCPHDDDVMCCRYHQTWSVFRCMEANDTIETTDVAIYPPLKILLPSILIPVILLVTWFLCCCRRRCHRYEMTERVREDRRRCSDTCCTCYNICGYELASDSESKMATNRNCFSAGVGYFDDVTSPVGRPAPPRTLDFPYRTENSCYLSARRGDCSCCSGGCHHRNQSLTRDDPLWPIHPSAPLSSLQQLQQGWQQQRQQQHKHMSYTFPASASAGFMSPSQAVNGLDVGKFVDRFSNAQQIYPTFPVLCQHCQGCGPATTHESFFSIASSPPPTYTDSSSLQSGGKHRRESPVVPRNMIPYKISNLKNRNYN